MTEQKLLLIQLKEGSSEAFNSIYKSYFNSFYGFVFSITRSHKKTKEIVQDTFIKVWTNRASIDPERSFKSWVYKIASNLITDTFRRQLSAPYFDDYMNYCSDEKMTVNPEADMFDYDAFRIELCRAKHRLSPRQLEVFSLVKEQGYSTTEVAQQLGISEQSVYNYLSQSLSVLRKNMGKFATIFWLVFTY